MGKRIHDGNWWLQRPRRLIPQVLHTFRHILFPCPSDCPINQKAIFTNPWEIELDDIEIGPSTVIQRGVDLLGKTRVGKNCRVGPQVSIKDCIIGDEVFIGHGAQLERSEIGNRVKIPHACYLGDAIVGDESNIGYGTGTSNFDGVAENKTMVGPRCFIETFVDFIAPVVLGEECFVASQTCVSAKEIIPPHSFIYEEVRDGFTRTAWRENCSFKSPHHWIWLWTKFAVDPKIMSRFFSVLGKNLGDYQEWLATPHPKLSNLEPRDFLKEYGESGALRIIRIVEEGLG